MCIEARKVTVPASWHSTIKAGLLVSRGSQVLVGCYLLAQRIREDGCIVDATCKTCNLLVAQKSDVR